MFPLLQKFSPVEPVCHRSQCICNAYGGIEAAAFYSLKMICPQCVSTRCCRADCLDSEIYLTKGYGADSLAMPGRPGIEQILEERSAGGCRSEPEPALAGSPESSGGRRSWGGGGCLQDD